ncbi:helix-turn-helix domain-containing protein [Streptomyces sp. NPDC057540]|uniref:helix-turn-helix domain-containing protein n=1 Tax=Streptomyces sp. NPDC057540 TaxID=3346160 RepID=UPI0036CAE83E
MTTATIESAAPDAGLVSALKAVLADLVGQLNPPLDPELRLYTPAEAAVLLGVTENWVEERIKARRIPFTKVGRFNRLAARHIRAIQDAGEVDPFTRRTRRTS